MNLEKLNWSSKVGYYKDRHFLLNAKIKRRSHLKPFFFYAFKIYMIFIDEIKGFFSNLKFLGRNSIKCCR